MNNHRGGCGHWRYFILILLGLALQALPSLVRAAPRAKLLILQEALAEDAPPTLQITHIDNSRFPELKIAVSGANLPAQLQALPAHITLDGSESPILDDQVASQGIQLALAIDTNNLSVRSLTGQTHYARLANVLNRLLNSDSIVADQDWVAGYWLTGAEPLQELQAWTQQANQVFNEFVANRPPEISATPLAAAPLRELIDEFANSEADAQMANHVRAILLFSTGQTVSEMPDVIAAAQAQSIRIYVVELHDADSPAAPVAMVSVLQQLALQTGGHYISLTDPESVAPLARRLMAAHDSRIFTVRAEATQPQKLDVSLMLPDGAKLAASADASTFEATNITAAQTNTPSAAAPPTPLPATAMSEPTALPPTTSPPQSPPTAVANAEAPIAPDRQIPGGLVGWGLFILLLLGALAIFLWLRGRRRQRQLVGFMVEGAEIVPAAGYLLADKTQPTRFQIELPATPLSSVARAPQHRPYRSPLVKPRAQQHQPAGFNSPPISTDPPSTKPRPEEYYKDFEDQLTVLHSQRGENAVTSRTDKTDPPIIGRLVRVVSDPRLPPELPIYGELSESTPEYWIRIGRHSKHNTIVINDISISRQHAAIIVRNGQLYLSDSASASGTFLTGNS
ncbi:MAG: FHA domain-containing protein [Caldilineaceae bacterium]